MKLKPVGIKNFRSFSDETIELADYTCLIGPNGAGKSNVLCALNVFFRESEGYATDLSVLDVEDFHQKNTDEPITITLTLTELSEEAQKDFADYFRHGQLVVSAIANFDNATPKAEVKQYGQRLGVETFKPFFKVLGDNAKVSELKTLYETILVGLGSWSDWGRVLQSNIPGWTYATRDTAVADVPLQAT